MIKYDKTFIYALIDPTTDKIRYIGKSNNPKQRLLRHIKDVYKNISYKNSWLRSLLSNSLYPELFILDEVSYEEWQFWEQHYISLYKYYGYTLTNMTIGGESGNNNKESLLKMVHTRKSRNSYSKTDTQKENLSKKYRNNGNPFYNKKHSNESKYKIGSSAKNRNNKWCVEIDNNGIIILWEQIEKAAKHYNINASSISKCCKGTYRNKTAAGKKWEYVSDMGNWIKCSTCNGKGFDTTINTSKDICSTCDGKKVVKKLTKEPSENEVNISSSKKNGEDINIFLKSSQDKEKEYLEFLENYKLKLLEKGK